MICATDQFWRFLSWTSSQGAALNVLCGTIQEESCLVKGGNYSNYLRQPKHTASPSVLIPHRGTKLHLYLLDSISSTVQSVWAPQGLSFPCYGGHPGWCWLCCCRWWHGSTASSPSLLPLSSGRRQQMPRRWWEGSGCPSHTPCLYRKKRKVGERGEKKEEDGQENSKGMNIYFGIK